MEAFGPRTHFTRVFCWSALLIFLGVIISPENKGIVQAEPLDDPEALYSSKDAVEILNFTSIKSSIYDSDNAWVVQFTHRFCGRCIEIAPVYKHFAKAMEEWQKLVKVAAIDCALDNVSICQEYEIQGYPTFFFFPPHSPQKKKSKADEEPNLYKGEWIQRSGQISDLKREVLELLTPHFPLHPERSWELK